MNKRQPAVLFSRTYTRKSGRKSIVWWYYVTDEQGIRRRLSLGTSSKTEARARLLELVRTHNLVPQRIRPTRFAEFTKGFWDWERSVYLKQKCLRGDRISRHWAQQNRGYLEHHLLPVFGPRRLSEITAPSIESFMFDLRERKGLSNKSINSVLGCLKAILGEAKREGLIADNPVEKIRRLRNVFQHRGILSIKEVRRLFSSPDNWPSYIHYAINLTACTSGARLGELRALKVKKVHPDRLIIDSVCRRLEGYVEGDTKTGEKGWRIVPIPAVTSRALQALLAGKSQEDFIFTLDGIHPISANTVTRALHRALANIGIPLEEQCERAIDFHSWRHLYGSILRGRVSDTDLRNVSGHASPAMTERYSHRMPERVEQYAGIQERVFSMMLQ